MEYHGKILITGGDGFLGSHVCQFFKDNNIKFQKTSHKDIDITNIDEVKRKVRNIDTVVHLAGNVRKNFRDTAENNFSINSAGTLNILEAARINNVKKVILASTVEVYSDRLPSGYISESDLCTPSSYYGQSKLLAENYCLQYSKKFKIECIILRFTYLYGEGMHKSRIISKLIDAAKNKQSMAIELGKSDFFDMLYVKDAARAIAQSLGTRDIKGVILNVSSNKKTTMKEVAEIIGNNYSNFKVTYKKKINCQPSYYYDNTRAKKIISFIPSYNLEEGLGDFIGKDLPGKKEYLKTKK